MRQNRLPWFPLPPLRNPFSWSGAASPSRPRQLPLDLASGALSPVQLLINFAESGIVRTDTCRWLFGVRNCAWARNFTEFLVFFHKATGSVRDYNHSF